MTPKEYILKKAAEEALEVAHRILKVMDFGADEVQEGQPLNNKKRVEEEMKDLVSMYVEAGFELPAPSRLPEKYEKVLRYMNYSEARGTVQDLDRALQLIGKLETFRRPEEALQILDSDEWEQLKRTLKHLH